MMLKDGLHEQISGSVTKSLEENGVPASAHGMLWTILHSESIFSSWDAFKDSIGFYGCYALLCYTIGICCMVLYLIYI
jgi:hypothetical protein